MHYLHRQLPKTSLIKVRLGGGGERERTSFGSVSDRDYKKFSLSHYISISHSLFGNTVSHSDNDPQDNLFKLDKSR
jgi:hypothetical protein